jgi:hypothetical protein
VLLQATGLEGSVSLLDLSLLAEQAAAAFDNSSAPLPRLLARAAGGLECPYFATEREAHEAEARTILRPVLNMLDEVEV